MKITTQKTVEIRVQVKFEKTVQLTEGLIMMLDFQGSEQETKGDFFIFLVEDEEEVEMLKEDLMELVS